jgi:putative peptide zinc metalloprotease protein
VTALEQAAVRRTADRYASLTVVRDGDGYVLGSARSAGFVAVPEVGGRVVRWLQDGDSIDECARRAAELVGEPVDVAGFVDGLTQAGLLAVEDTVEADHAAGVAAWKRALGRGLFGPAGLAVQGSLSAVAVATIVAVPRVRPAYTDAVVTHTPLASIVLIAVLGMALGLAHEFAHVLAAWAAGVSSRVSISRRMVALVYQTDLTRLWSVPRRARIVPLLAGLIFDGATVGGCNLLELAVGERAPLLVIELIRLIAFLNVSAIVFQFLIFLRTDVYALFALATGCKNLWGTKGAVARRAMRRATGEDLALLDSVGGREIRWAKVFLCLYVPGVLWTGWYFFSFGLPALRRIVTTALHAVFTDGLLSSAGAAGAVAFLLAVASTGFVLWGLLRSMVRLGRRLITRPDSDLTDPTVQPSDERGRQRWPAR